MMYHVQCSMQNNTLIAYYMYIILENFVMQKVSDTKRLKMQRWVNILHFCKHIIKFRLLSNEFEGYTLRSLSGMGGI